MHLTTRPWISYEALLRLLNQYDTHKHIYLVQNTMVSAIKSAIESNVIQSRRACMGEKKQKRNSAEYLKRAQAKGSVDKSPRQSEQSTEAES
jgi:hypothetical protein